MVAAREAPRVVLASNDIAEEVPLLAMHRPHVSLEVFLEYERLVTEAARLVSSTGIVVPRVVIPLGECRELFAAADPGVREG